MRADVCTAMRASGHVHRGVVLACADVCLKEIYKNVVLKSVRTCGWGAQPGQVLGAACIVMAYIDLAYIVMAYIVMARQGLGCSLCSDGLYSFGL